MKTGIWTYDKKAGYQLVENPETIFPQTFLDSISMEIFAENNEGQYPMLIERQDTLPGYEVCFTDDCHNAWYTVVTAELDEETTITAVTRFEWVVNYVFDADRAILDVQDINNQLSDWVEMIEAEPDLSYRTSFRIQLPAAVTNTQGQDIVIPAGLRSVRIEGSRDFQKQVWYTTIYNCGIQANCDEVFLSKLHLYGVTQDVEQSANPTITKGKIGFYGSAQSQYSDCWFSRFDIGVEFGNDCSDGLRFGGQHVIIENCNIGYYMDNTTTTNGGNIQMDDFVFRGNDIAVFLKNVSKNNTLKPYDYKIINSFFNDNRVDVKNQTGRWFFFPKNVINHTNGPVVTRSVVSASHVPVLEDGNTSMYPVAYEVGMMQFEYLYEESGVVSNDLSYQIPVSEISGQEYAVIEDDKPIVAYTFDTTQMAPTLMKLAAGGVQETPATFDPTVELTSAADKITLVMDAMPEGKSARVFVPCQWRAVQVLEGETQIEAEADGVTVSFLATKGGTYEIIAQTSAGGDTGGIVIPSGPVADDKQDEAPKADFSDVAEEAWYADAVQYVYEKGLMNGMGGGKFQPEAETSRAMVITMLARLAGADVDDSDPWYAKALAWAVDNGVSDGTTPNGAITRQQIVTMLWRSAGSPKPVGKLKEFADADKIASYALDAMTWAVEQKIIQGVGGNRLDPTATATRAQIATMFRNYLER